MAITKYDFSALNQNFISGIKEFLMPLWNWTKVEGSQAGDQIQWVAFYIDDSTYFDFEIGTVQELGGYHFLFTVQRFNESERIINIICETYINIESNNTDKIKLRFTKVGSGFMLGFEFYTYSDKKLLGDYTKPIIMCCDLGDTYAFMTNGIKIKNENSIVMPTTTNNEIYHKNMTEVETVSLTRKITENTVQLIPICTNSGLYSTNGFTPFITYNDTLVPQKFTLGGKQYYGNGLMVLLDE